MIKKFKIKKINIKFVLKHRFNKKEQSKFETKWRGWELGLWFRRNKIVSRKNVKTIKDWGKNMVNDYTFGINLLWVKMWVTINKNGLDISENEL